MLAPPTATSESSITRCLAALQISGFDLKDFDNYERWIDESTIMQVADTGIFLGPDGIREYVEIALAPEGAYVIKEVEDSPESNRILPITADGNECVVMITAEIAISTYQLSSPVDLIQGNRLTYTLLDDAPFPSDILMHRIDVYTPSGALGSLFEATYGVDFATRICNTMENNCALTFENNCYGHVDECIADMLTLPPTSDDGKLDGKSFGCRVLHGYLAARNDGHCPHISFDPEYDPSCFIKCQKSKGISNEDMFHPFELGFLAQHALDVGLGEQQWKVREE